MNVLVIVALAAAPAHAAPEMAGKAVASALTAPVLRLELPSAMPVSQLPPLPAALSAEAPTAKPRALPVPSRDAARDEAADKLAQAGFDALLRERGLILFHVIKARTRSGERLFLTLSLPSDGRPFERGEGDEGRRAELARRVDAAEKRIVREAARIMGMDEDMVAVNGRLIESCCGTGCQSCLLTKRQHARRWTGLPPRPARTPDP